MSGSTARKSGGTSRANGGPSTASRPSGASRPDASGPTLHFRVARVSPDPLNLRAEPSTSAAVVARLPEGTLVEPLGPAADADGLVWVQVQPASGEDGWAAAKFLDIVAAAPDAEAAPPPGAPPAHAPDAQPPAAPSPRGAPAGSDATFRVNTDGIRLRAEPSTSAEILAELRSGTLVEDDGTAPASGSGFEWRHVSVGGQTGWVASQFLSPATGGQLHFDPNTPTELQRQDWTCSIRSTMWVLKSLGVEVTAEEAQDAMSPQYVRSDVGLLDASGAGIVEVLRERWGITAFNRAPVSFDDVAGWAGHYPIAMGGRNWYHWVAVRGLNAEGNLVLANPGGTGPRFGQQTLNRQQFEDLGWFSAVVVPVD